MVLKMSSNVIDIYSYVTGARYFKPRTITASRAPVQDSPIKTQDNALRLQAPRRGDMVRTVDGRRGFVLGEKPDGSLLVSIAGARQSFRSRDLEKAGA